MQIRTGLGFDVHRLAEGETLWLGGVLIPHYKGTVAHSDGDVLIHAICDALLGALALGDIGLHFPDTDNSYKNADSKELLAKVYEMVCERGWSISNIDSTISAQQPKLRPYIDDMRKCVAGILTIDMNAVSVKATTTEKLGFEGTEEGMSALASVLLIKP